jgi:ABC-type glycerol-3-phosphate transport system substrate-binding protein
MALPGKLGIKDFKFDARLPSFATFFADLPDPKPVVNWAGTITNFGMMLNDQLGDCTCAALGHQEQIWTLNSSSEFTPSDEDVLKLYENTCDYNPNDPNSDQGGIPLDILKQWYKTPGLFAGRSLDAFAPFNPFIVRAMHCSIAYLGGVYLAVNLPKSIENQGFLWDVPPEGTQGDGAPGSLGGHAVIGIGYDKDKAIYQIISWGTIYTLTQAFIDTYCIQSFGLVSHDWIATSGKAPSGLDINQLKSDLNAIHHLRN